MIQGATPPSIRTQGVGNEGGRRSDRRGGGQLNRTWMRATDPSRRAWRQQIAATEARSGENADGVVKSLGMRGLKRSKRQARWG
jgi:hypothetical protein